MAADLVIKSGWVVTPDGNFKGGVAISNEMIVAIGANDSIASRQRGNRRQR